MVKALQIKQASLTELLPYWELRDELVVLNNGLCEFGIEICMPSTSLTPEAALRQLHAGLQTTLRHAVPEGERLRLYVEIAPLHRDVLDRYQQLGRDGSAVAQLFSQDKLAMFDVARRRGELVDYRAYLSCTVTRPGHSNVRKTQARRSLNPREWDEWRKAALSTRDRFTTFLTQAGWTPVPLSDQQLFSLLWRYFNPQARLGDSPHYAPPGTFLPQRYILKGLHRAPASLRNRLVGSEIAHHHWDHLRIGHYFLGAVSMGSLPVGYTEVGMPTRLLGLPGMTWLLLDYQHERYGPATRALEARARRFHSAEDDTGGLTTYIDASVRAGASESEEAALHLVQTGSHPFRLGMTALFAAQTRAHLTEHLEEASAAFAQLSGITPYQEGVALLEQFGALAPFSGRVNERLHLVMEENATDFIPINGPWRGSERPVVLLGNRWNSVTALDPFDPHAANWNGIIIGGSGTGKTFLMQRIVNEVLRTGADLVIVDRGFGYAPLVQLYGGEVISFDVTGCVGLNPFDLPPGVTEPDDDKTNFLLALIRAMIPGNAADTSLEDAILMAAIVQTYARHRTEYTVNGVVDVAVTGATLSDLVRVLVTLEEIGDRPVRELERDIARQLALKLTRWTGDTPFGRLLDRTTTIPAEAPIMYYETSRLERYPELQNVATLIISEEVWRRAKRQPSRRKLVVLDEFSALLTIPQAADFIVELYRRFRRYNAAVYAVTQTLKDFTAPQATGILQNTTFHYLFPLPGEDALIQELLNLPDEAIAEFQQLVTSERYREVLVWLRRDGRLEGDVLRISPRPLEYWAFSTHGDDVALREDTTSQLDGQLLAAIQTLAARHPYGVRNTNIRWNS